MSNLVPEKRTDKRGNIVTRWVRSFRKQADKKAIPAPVVAYPRFKKQEITEDSAMKADRIVRGLFASNIESDVVFEEYDQILESVDTIARYDPDLLSRIDEAVGVDPVDDYFWKSMISAKIVRDHETDRLEQTLDQFHSALIINPMINGLARNHPNISGHYNAFSYTEVVSDITMGSGLERDDDVIAGVTMIAFIKGIGPNHGGWSPRDNAYVNYDEIIKDARFIAEHREDVEGILPELHARNVSDREGIEQLLSNPAPALMEGEL